MKRKNTDIKENPTHEKKRKSKGSPYLGDARLVPRVKQYLEANKDKAVISVALMAEDLQATYSRDYGRKKKNAFRLSVEKAYEYVRASLKKESAKKEDKYNKYEKHYLKKKQKILDCESLDTSSESDSFLVDEDSFSSDNPDYVIQPDTNAMNDCLKNLYRTTPVKSNPNSKHGKSEQNPIFVIDRNGNKSGRASGSKPDLHTGSRSDITLDLEMDRSENSVMLGSDLDSHNNGSSSCTATRTMARKETNTNQEEDPELIILETGSTMSDDCIFSENDLLYLTSSSLDKIDKVSSEPRYRNTVTRKKDVTEKINTKADKVKVTPHGKRHRNMEQTEPRLEKKRTKTNSTEKVNKKQSREVYQSTITFSDIGGNDKTLEEICKLLVHMKHPEVYERLGVIPPRGFLLHGPPGCGKTLMAHAIAGELELPFIKVAATELISGVSGESEEKIREIFELATDAAPCVLFIDEVDAITPKRETASKDMERRVVSQLLTCMDDLNQKQGGHVLVLGATNRPDSLDPALRRAGRFDREISLGIPDEGARYKILQVLCKGLRLEEQFDFKQLAHLTPGFVGADLMALTRESAIIAVNRVFQALQSNGGNPETDNSGSMTVNLNEVSHLCHSSCACDESGANVIEVVFATESSTDERMSWNESKSRLSSLDAAAKRNNEESTEKKSPDFHGSSTKSDKFSEFKSVLSWLKESPPLSDEQLDDLYISMADFREALCHVQPSAKREGFATIPDVTWEDVGALKGVREELQMAIMAPVQHPEQFKALGLSNPPGILLAGPPGCGKTLLAKAIANESGINFISVKGPELLNMYVGESERAVRQVFQRAKNSAPCVIFFDELDALCPRRSGAAESGSSIRVVNQLLTEMDGLETRKQVFIMAATNRPDIIDPAILRPGRLDKVLYVGMPNAGDRLDILKTITKNGTKPPLASDVDLKTIAEDKRCEGYTGADLAALVREAAVTALRSFMSQTLITTPVIVNMANFDVAFHKVKPSVSAKDQLVYTKMKSQSTPTNLE